MKTVIPRQTIRYQYQLNDTDSENDIDEKPDEDGDSTTNYTLQVPANTHALNSGRWHSTEEAYKLVLKRDYVHSDVAPGDKSDRFMLVDNSRNVPRLQKIKSVNSLMTVGYGYLRKVIQLNTTISSIMIS